MTKSSNWQEDGTRIGGVLLDAEDAHMFVKELKYRVKDPDVLKEVEAFLTDGTPLSQKTRDILRIISMGIVMQMYKDQRK